MAKSSFACTDGEPDLVAALKTGNPKHCTRFPRKAAKNQHYHVSKAALSGATQLKKWNDTTHNSRNTLWQLCKPCLNN